MKVNIEIDCTPLEARQFFGLPDVGPMQVAVMEKLQQQVTANIDKVSPEALMQSWFTFDPKIAERFQDMFVAMAGLIDAGETIEAVAVRFGTSERHVRQRLRLGKLAPELLDAFRYYYGPTMNAYAASETNGRTGDLHRELRELFESQNKSGSPDVTSIPATFLRVTMTIQ